MSSYTYPAPPATVVGGDKVDVHHLMNTPALIARRVRELLDGRYIADALLTGRFQAVGGAVLYETGEPIETEDDPEAVAPGAGYPLTKANSGTLAAAKTTKWGRDTEVTDEAISRLGINPVDRAFAKLVNRSVRFVDSAAMGVIASRLSETYDVTAAGNPGAWTTADAIVEGALLAKAQVDTLNEGFNLNVIVLNDTQWARVIARLHSKGYFPREQGNPLLTNIWPEAFGLTWMKTPNTVGPNPVMLDTAQLGGMADENIGGPGYIQTGGVGVETKAIREDKLDKYLLRARRVTVPVVTEPQAGIVIQNTGI